MVEITVPKNTDQLLMFYGMLNLDMLSTILPFPHLPKNASDEDKLKDLMEKSVAITCHGWTRVFG